MTARPVRLLALATAAATLALAGCAPSAEDGGEDGGAASGGAGEGSATAKVGIVYSETGPLAAYGEQFKAGLEAGIDHATDGTGAVDGTTIELTYRDDAGNPDTAVAAAKDLIGQELRRGVATDEHDLIEHCRAELAAFKVPVRIGAVPAIPLVGIGKTDVVAVRALVEQLCLHEVEV